MSHFDPGKKIFFLYPQVEFSRNILRKLYESGFEIYQLRNTENLIPLMRAYSDSLLFVNSDYPYENFDFEDFNNTVLKQDDFRDLMVYSFFTEKVTYGDRVKDYISLSQDDKTLFSSLKKILEQAGAHGKREYVRFGSYSESITPFSFICSGREYKASLHDISPRAISLSSQEDLSPLMGQLISKIILTVGAYRIGLSGLLSQKREISGKVLYIVIFGGDDYQEELFNFIYTSLEKKMDELIENLGR